MATYTWTPKSYFALWSDPANWSGGVVPSAGDDVTINASGDFIELTGVSETVHSVTLGAASTSGGEIDLTQDATLTVGGAFDIEDGTLNIGTGSTLTLGGVLTFTSGFITSQGVIAGGTLVAAGGVFNAATLDGVTLKLAGSAFPEFSALTNVTLEAAGPIVLPESTSLTVTGGLTVLDGNKPGTLDATAGYLTLTATGTQTLDNVTLLLGDESTIATTGTLTLGPHVRIDATDTYGPLRFDTTGSATDSIVNDGSIIETVGTNVVDNGFGAPPLPTVNDGFFEFIGQGTSFYAPAIDNAGTLVLDGVSIDESDETLNNSGQIVVEGAGATLGLGFSGNFANTDGTIDVKRGGTLLLDGTLGGGSLLGDGGTFESTTGATLSGISVADALDIYRSQLTLTADTTFVGIGGAPAAISLDGSNVYFSAPRTLDKVDITLGNAQSGFGGGLFGTALTLGPDETIRFAGTAGGEIGASSTLLNEGTIDGSPGGVFLGAYPYDPNATSLFINQGTVLTDSGEDISVYASTFDNPGSFVLASGATLTLRQATLADLNSITDAGGTIVVDTLDLGGGLLTVSPGRPLEVGTFLNGTVDAASGGFSFIPGIVGFNHVTWEGPLVIDNEIVPASNGLTLTGPGGAGPGSLVIDGLNSALNFSDNETLDHAAISIGDETGTAGNPAFDGIYALNGNLTLGAAATTTLAGDYGDFYIAAAGTVENDGTILASLGEGVLAGALGTDFVNKGLVSVSSGAGTFGAAAALTTNDGTFEAAGGVIAVAADANADPGTLGGTGVFEIGAGGTVIIYDQFAGKQTFAFQGGPSTLQLQSPGGALSPITGFGAGETIVLPSLLFTGGTPTYANGVLSVPGDVGGGASHQALDLTFAPGYGVANVTLIAGPNDATEIVIPCYAAGTHLDTPGGERRIESLCVGDLVLTVSGIARPVVWIGRRAVRCDRHPSPASVWPVRIAAHAFGEGLPARALRLSPDHAVFVDGVLIPVKYLIDGVGVAQVPTARVTYVHVELDRHDILLAEGLPAESLLPSVGRAGFANGGGVAELHPTFASRAWEAEGCAPLIVAGPTLAAVRARLRLGARKTRRRLEGEDGVRRADARA